MALTLVLGGISSGKSRFAADLAAAAGGEVLFLATGRASDPEMEARIEAHRGQRPASWRLLEEPLEIGRASGAGTVVLDSVDGWLANRMESEGGSEVDWRRERLRELESACAAAVEELARGCRLIAVSSEVGLSPVPLHPYGRAFADVLGRINQRLAALSDRAFLVVAGVPVHLPARGA
jgi:adenosylcobinamide kinase / adenosylcobinamide-phosphate guanylyltransferase